MTYDRGFARFQRLYDNGIGGFAGIGNESLTIVAGRIYIHGIDAERVLPVGVVGGDKHVLISVVVEVEQRIIAVVAFVGNRGCFDQSGLDGVGRHKFCVSFVFQHFDVAVSSPEEQVVVSVVVKVR